MEPIGTLITDAGELLAFARKLIPAAEAMGADFAHWLRSVEAHLAGHGTPGIQAPTPVLPHVAGVGAPSGHPLADSSPIFDELTAERSEASPPAEPGDGDGQADEPGTDPHAALEQADRESAALADPGDAGSNGDGQAPDAAPDQAQPTDIPEPAATTELADPAPAAPSSSEPAQAF